MASTQETEMIREPAEDIRPIEDEVILRAEQIVKVYPGTTALNGVDFDVYRGKVNVLVGENGAGKSTLMKILAGVEQPTSGHIYLHGKEIFNRSIVEAGENGIGIISQEMMIFPNLSVTENLFIGREKKNGIVVSAKEQREETIRILNRMEQKIDPDQLVGELRVGQQQIIEIARAISEKKQILIMDEPTSA
ncbi:MAG TPA: ATP-binding cassette domain-containing protein, partial [Flexilinea sp.]|nr:ATP-binding cassette domain-containing protein [Flexilinea sp.]